MKKSAAGDALIVRAYNVDTRPVQARVRLSFPFGRVALANLAEEELTELTPGADGCLEFEVPGRKIVTLRFEK